MPELGRGITLTKLISYFSKANLMICVSSLISSPSYKVLAQIVFDVACSQGSIMSRKAYTMHDLKRGHNYVTKSPTEKR